MKGVNIVNLEKIHSDERGEIFSLKLLDTFSEIVFVRRRKGTVSGKHYHTGKDKSKNPERLIVVSGRIEAKFFDIKTEEYQKKILNSMDMIEVFPNVYHELKAVEEVVFIEPKANTGYEDVIKPDDDILDELKNK